MIPVIVILLLFLLVAIPIGIWVYFYFSKYYSCPFCGESILKTERTCPKCKSKLPGLETLDIKTKRVAEAYRDGGKQFLYDGERPEDFEKGQKK